MSKQKNVTVILLFDQPVLGHDYRLENLETLITYFEQKLSLPQIILVTGYSDKYLLGSKYTKRLLRLKTSDGKKQGLLKRCLWDSTPVQMIEL